MESRFDALAKTLAGGVSRREALRRLGGTAAGAVLASLGLGCRDDVVGPPRIPTDGLKGPSQVPGTGGSLTPAAGRCRQGGRKCRQNAECCSQFCDPARGVCACRSGSFECPSSGQCIFCGSNQVFNPDTCTCQCAPGATTCTVGGSTICCAQGLECCVFFGPFCTETQTDRNNCGRCGGTCSATEVCFGGRCCQADNLNQCRFV